VVATLRSRFGKVHAALAARSDRAIAAVCAPYGLLLVCEDVIVNGVLQAGQPLALSAWRGRTGMSELPPIVCRGDRGAWSARVRVDVADLRIYARAVYAATDAYFARQTRGLPTPLSARVLAALLSNQRQLLHAAERRAFAIC
jgi:hypothetical protein